jgi:hypothetical protein
MQDRVELKVERVLRRAERVVKLGGEAMRAQRVPRVQV